jgi:hypothetical protein
MAPSTDARTRSENSSGVESGGGVEDRSVTPTVGLRSHRPERRYARVHGGASARTGSPIAPHSRVGHDAPPGPRVSSTAVVIHG